MSNMDLSGLFDPIYELPTQPKQKLIYTENHRMLPSRNVRQRGIHEFRMDIAEVDGGIVISFGPEFDFRQHQEDRIFLSDVERQNLLKRLTPVNQKPKTKLSKKRIVEI